MRHTHRWFSRGLGLALGLGALLSAPRPAEAIWPPRPEMTSADLAMMANWPNDPGYAGQWEHWSWVPGMNLTVPNFRTEEAALGAGNNTDRAWAISTGDPRVLIAVLDSGINWDNDDIVNKIALNTAELPLPEGATSYDSNGDGVVNIVDYLRDSRVTCGTGPASARNPRQCRGADGMPNDPNGNGVFDPGDLIRVFSDRTDADRNGYVDDIAGWDFFQDDNDPADATRFGHGTGEMRWSAAETNNGIGDAGDCPRCMLLPIRAADSFIGEVDDFAQGVVYSVDRGARVVQEALGTLDNSTFARRAIDYAYARNVPVIASAADENSRHHNVPGTNNHTLTVHAIRYDTETLTSSTTFLNFNNCTNFGAQLVLSVSGTGCSSEATGHTAGHAGLMQSYALEHSLTPALTAEEIYQLLARTTDDINVPESQPGHPRFDDTKYPSLPGWDQRFGYGRTNARRAMEWLRDGKIPPEVDVTSPRWFTVLNPDRPAQQTLRIEGRIAAARAPRFDYTVEYATGVEPADTAWVMVRRETNVTAAVTDRLADIDLRTLQVNNPGERANRYTLTVRIRAVAHYDAPVGDVPGEVRRAFYVHRDESVLPNFPIDVGGSGESSAKTVDLDGDGSREIIYGTADGDLHAYRANGTEMPGFPAHTVPLYGMRSSHATSYVGSAAYSGESPAIDPGRVFDPIVATPAVADLDGDGRPEIVVNSYHGTVHVFRADGSNYGHGFPYALPDVPSAMTAPDRILQRGLFCSPVLADLDGDMRLEIIFGAMDGKLYALDAMTGMVKPGYPVVIHFPEAGTEYNRVFGNVGVGNFNGDTIPDVVVVSNEKLRGDNNTGAIYLVHGDGNNHAGGAFHPNWPIAVTSFNFFPLVGEGVSGAPPIADLDGDGRDEIAFTGNALPTIAFVRGEQSAMGRRPALNTLNRVALAQTSRRGALTNNTTQIVSFANVFSMGAWGDMDGDRTPDYVISGAELNLAINLGGGGRARPFYHLVGAFSGRDGYPLPGYPQLLEDYTFFMNPAIASVDGDPFPELIVGTGGYFLEAFDACGRTPAGWPKFTGQWIIPSPALGDLDGDHRMEVVSGTRGGLLWAWRTQADDRTANVQWESFRHDNRNTGNYGTPLTQGVRTTGDAGTIQCPVPPEPDAGTSPEDGGVVADGGSTAPPATDDGCGCRATGSAPTGARGLALLGLGLAASLRRRRRRAD
ncbi:MAG: VCBS repeat-containing protein [Deltaproteobacteria bacterium]|nr:VCBS repeat-containing protein [Deltaproteobacteria bacterium]